MEQKTVSGKIPAELHARFRRFTCSLTIAYQHGRYVPAHTSDTGKSAMTCRRPYVFPPRRTDICVSLRRAIHFARKEDQAGFFAFDYGAGDNDTPVARHTRPGGRPRVVISKTLGEPASGCKRSTRLPCSHVRGGRAANTAQKTKSGR